MQTRIKYHDETPSKYEDETQIRYYPTSVISDMDCFPHYTSLLVEICMRSWKAIEVMPDAASELATSFA